jgi:hypothetical protein
LQLLLPDRSERPPVIDAMLEDIDTLDVTVNHPLWLRPLSLNDLPGGKASAKDEGVPQLALTFIEYQ